MTTRKNKSKSFHHYEARDQYRSNIIRH